jgi:hypothetical protein
MHRYLATALIVLAVTGCKKDEPTEAAPSAAPAAPPPATVAPEPKAEPAAPGAAAEPAPVASAAPSASAEPVASASAAPAPSSSAEEPKKAAPTGNLTPCCNALTAAANKGGSSQNKYKSAAATCESLAKQVKSGKAIYGAAKVTVRAQLSGVPVPSGC